MIAVLAEIGDPVALLQLHRNQRIGDPIGMRVDVGVTGHPPREAQRDRVGALDRVVAERCTESRGERHGLRIIIKHIPLPDHRLQNRKAAVAPQVRVCPGKRTTTLALLATAVQ